MGLIKIIKPGFLTTVQDAGRFCYQQYGIPAAGAMDNYSLQLANILVGNLRFEAALEITVLGPTIEFESSMAFAAVGAETSARLNGFQIKMNKTNYANEGDILEFSLLANGSRLYLALSGGIDVPSIMGSKSTYMRGKSGGFKGRKLEKNDLISTNEVDSFIGIRELPFEVIPKYTNSVTARVIMGPEKDRFTASGIKTFLNSSYSVSDECDRMGYKLNGPIIEHHGSSTSSIPSTPTSATTSTPPASTSESNSKSINSTPTKAADIISSPVNFGTIQIPANGNPIIMMADRQTTGGYTRIGNIISVDIPSISQLKSGGIIKFNEIGLEEAQLLLSIQDKKISWLEKSFNIQSESSKNTENRYKINVNGKAFDVNVFKC